MSVLDHVVSFVDGRVRLRHPALKDASVAELVRSSVASVEGVSSVQVNPATGSLLVLYDPEKLGRAELIALAEQGMAFLPEQPAASRRAECPCRKAVRSLVSRPVTRFTNKVMLVSAAAALAGLFAGGNVHRVAGGVFFLAGLQHLAAHRKSLW